MELRINNRNRGKIEIEKSEIYDSGRGREKDREVGRITSKKNDYFERNESSNSEKIQAKRIPKVE